MMHEARRVTADVASAEGTQRATAEIAVRDILIAGLGDSIASGEGNPDRPIALSDEGFCFRYYLSAATSQYYRPSRAGYPGGRACEAPLSLVVAPAGWGKTTVVLDWLEHGRIPAAWVSLDVTENDPKRFWSYLLAAVRTVAPDVGEQARRRLRAAGSEIIRDVLPRLEDLSGDDGRSRVRKLRCRRAADPAAPARHDHDPAVEAHRVSPTACDGYRRRAGARR